MQGQHLDELLHLAQVYRGDLGGEKVVEINPDLHTIPFTPRLDLHDVREALVLCGKPSRPMLPFAKSSGRLTDVTRYGGTHRLRFDSNGQGLGVAGRRDIREGQDFLNTNSIIYHYNLPP